MPGRSIALESVAVAVCAILYAVVFTFPILARLHAVSVLGRLRSGAVHAVGALLHGIPLSSAAALESLRVRGSTAVGQSSVALLKSFFSASSAFWPGRRISSRNHSASGYRMERRLCTCESAGTEPASVRPVRLYLCGRLVVFASFGGRSRYLYDLCLPSLDLDALMAWLFAATVGALSRGGVVDCADPR